MIGYVTEEMVHSNPYLQLISGSTWMVRDGVNWIWESEAISPVGAPTICAAAPRTAIGHDIEGRLMILEVK